MRWCFLFLRRQPTQMLQPLRPCAELHCMVLFIHRILHFLHYCEWPGTVWRCSGERSRAYTPKTSLFRSYMLEKISCDLISYKCVLSLIFYLVNIIHFIHLKLCVMLWNMWGFQDWTMSVLRLQLEQFTTNSQNLQLLKTYNVSQDVTNAYTSMLFSIQPDFSIKLWATIRLLVSILNYNWNTTLLKYTNVWNVLNYSHHMKTHLSAPSHSPICSSDTPICTTYWG